MSESEGKQDLERVERVFRSVRDSTKLELERIRQEVAQVRGLVSDAIRTLASSFSGVRAGVQSQLGIVRELLLDLAGASATADPETFDIGSYLKTAADLLSVVGEPVDAAARAPAAAAPDLQRLKQAVDARVQQVSALTPIIDRSLGAAITGMQFEDIVHQLLNLMDRRLDLVESFVTGVLREAEEMGFGDDQDDAEKGDVASRLEKRLSKEREALGILDDDSITQESMADGDVDLF